jgi:hypothetical protein
MDLSSAKAMLVFARHHVQIVSATLPISHITTFWIGGSVWISLDWPSTQMRRSIFQFRIGKALMSQPHHRISPPCLAGSQQLSADFKPPVVPIRQKS